MLDLTESIAPKSDQLNADDLISGPRTFTITEVKPGSPEQPFDFHLAEFPGRPYRPSKSMRRVMVEAWGRNASEYAGRRLTLYREPTIKFGGQEVGGIRISHMSHIAKPLRMALTEARGKRAPFIVQPLPDAPRQPDYLAEAKAATDLATWQQVWRRARDAGHLSDALKAQLTPIGESLKPQPEDAEPTLPDAS